MTMEETREGKPVVEEKPKKKAPATQAKPSKGGYYERLFQGGK